LNKLCAQTKAKKGTEEIIIGNPEALSTAKTLRYGRTQRYVGRHAMLTDRLREVQEAVSTALTEAMGRAKK
jgi:hypothetical protein